MDEKVLEFWRQHSLTFLEMALGADKRERLANPDGYGKAGRECGDTLEMFLLARNGTIRSASFHTDGCIYTAACANSAIRMIEGKSQQEAWEITPERIADFLETLPESEFHCAELAVRALQLALKDLRETERQPWLKFYRK
ncbi:MAG: iron-sulfur cluster assembly scaffold protein [Desulfobacteraceae bacterium]|nr:iron-sulfur cluster assembly scaffold protein [Desulfobacteraceae bacterium]